VRYLSSDKSNYCQTCYVKDLTTQPKIADAVSRPVPLSESKIFEFLGQAFKHHQSTKYKRRKKKILNQTFNIEKPPKPQSPRFESLREIPKKPFRQNQSASMLGRSPVSQSSHSPSILNPNSLSAYLKRPPKSTDLAATYRDHTVDLPKPSSTREFIFSSMGTNLLDAFHHNGQAKTPANHLIPREKIVECSRNRLTSGDLGENWDEIIKRVKAKFPDEAEELIFGYVKGS
jgi:hypothetical protein